LGLSDLRYGMFVQARSAETGDPCPCLRWPTWCRRREPGSTPLDAAPDRRPLVGVDRPPGNHGVDRRPDVSGRHRDVVSGAGVVELAAVDESTLAVEDERVGRAGRGES